MDTSLEALDAFYRRYLKEYPEGGGWPSITEAEQVYRNATSSFLIPWKEINYVLDVGSGTGALLPYLRREMGYRGDYTGLEALDVLSNEVPAELLADEKASFRRGDFLAKPRNLQLRADWVFAIGTLGTDQPSKSAHDLSMIVEMAANAVIGFTIDLNDVRVISPERLIEVPGLVAHDVGLLVASFSPHIRYTEIHIVHDQHKNCAINVRLREVSARMAS